MTGDGPDPRAALDAAFESCVLADRSDLARILARGPDILGLLHRLSTGDVAGLEVGRGRQTVLTSAKGRIVERLFVHHLGPARVLLNAGPGGGPRATEQLRRYTIAERTGLEEITEATAQQVVVGPRAAAALDAAGLPRPEACGSVEAALAGLPVSVLGQDGLSADGFSVVAARAGAGAVAAALDAAVAAVGGRLAASDTLESYRVLRGLPGPGGELSEEHNPLEAGLWDAVSFDKGCYLGQEVVARLRTYDKVARSIVGLELPPGAGLPPRGSPLVRDGRVVGTLTSVALPADRDHAVGLGYLKRRELDGPGELDVGPAGSAVRARVVPLPFR